MRITGADLAEQVEVLFGAVPATVVSVREEAGASIADVRTPPHEDETVDVTVRNLDGTGTPVPGEEATLAAAYRFLRSQLTQESDLTRLVRTLLRKLKSEVLEATSLSVSYPAWKRLMSGASIRPQR